MPLAAGARIGRIRIEELLGAGGMGEVWRGFDEKLERPVALKVIHGDKRFSAAMRGRFLREARLLSKLDHPNICRIYDVLEREDGDYLVLELVDGQTLRDRLRTMTRSEAIAIALEVARVLAAAHERGIIHRDLKPDNIMITRSGAVKVLDFGLARTIGDDEPRETASGEDESPDAVTEDGSREAVVDDAPREAPFADDVEKTAVYAHPLSTTAPDGSRTVAGSLVGTLQYMSPEQARSLALTGASDVYALGIVLYELVTGRKAYGDEIFSMNDLLVRVRTAQLDPFEVDDRDVDALVRRMLQLDPADRPDAAEVVRALEAIEARPARRRQRMAIAGAIVALIVLLGGAFAASTYFDAPRRLFGDARGGRVAILPFENATGDRSLVWAELGLAQLVAEGLSRAKGAEVVRPGDVVRAMTNLSLRAGSLTPEQRQRLLTILGADVLIAPTVTAEGGQYTIRYAALTSRDAEAPASATSSVLIEAAKQMSVALAQRIDPVSSTAAVREQYSLDNLANMLYAMAQEELRTRGVRIASHYLQVCVDRDPEFLAAKMELASCHQAMGERAAAEQLMGEALARARQRRDDEMLTKGLISRASWNLEWGDYAGAKRDSDEALATARRTGERSVVGAAQTLAGEVAWRRGELPQARAVLEDALRTFVAVGDLQRQADVYNTLGLVADSSGDKRAARPLYAKSLAIAHRIGDRFLEATVLGNYANAEGDAGNFARAAELTRRQIALTREISDAMSEIFGLANLGLWLWAQGKEAEAISATEEALAAARKVGNPRVETLLLSNLAVAHAKAGNLAKARPYADEAVARSRGLEDPEGERDVQLGVAYTAIREGRLREAEAALDRAERWQRNARTMMMRGRLAYARGDYARAFALIREAKAQNDAWFVQNEQMYRAFEESATTGRESTIAFEGN